MSKFLNPYHFVPLPSRTPMEAETPWDHPEISLDSYSADLYSGRITFHLKAVSPVLCGNETVQRKGWTKLIMAAERAGSPIIPGSSLRGLISSMLETVTHSSMRVLKNSPMSHRKAINRGSISAIGMLVQGTDGLRLRPLTLPTLPENDPFLDDSYKPFFSVGNDYPLLKAYFHHTANYQPPHQDSYSADKPVYHYAKLPSKPTLENGRQLAVNNPMLDSNSDTFILAQQMEGPLLSEDAYQALPDGVEKNTYTRGILRILSKYGRRLPQGKTHEYFIPYPVEAESLPTFPVQEAVDRFHSIADLRTEEDPTLPYELKGTSRHSPAGTHQLRLQPGDLVFFLPSGDGSSIHEVSISSIWRGFNGYLHDFLLASPESAELLPYHKERQTLTVAERMMGLVEDRPKKNGQSSKSGAQARALASRIQVLDATLHQSSENKPWIKSVEMLSPEQRGAISQKKLTDLPLHNLSGPKPPSPSFYFQKKTGEAIYSEKKDVSTDSHKIKGRKFYLSRKISGWSQFFVHQNKLHERDGIAALIKQHQSFDKAIRPATVLQGEIRFDQLSAIELGALLYVLQPCEGYRHLIGHAKPLGMGQMEFSDLTLCLIDRQARYRTLSPEAGKSTADAGKISSLRKAFTTWADRSDIATARAALERIGTNHLSSPDLPIHYPQINGIIADAANFHSEHFKWFTRNDRMVGRDSGQFLRPLVDHEGKVATQIPPLLREISNDPPPVTYGPLQSSGPPGNIHELFGKTITVRAMPKEKDNRVPFCLLWDGEPMFTKYSGYFEIGKYDRGNFASRHPSGTEIQAIVRSAQGNRVVDLSPAPRP